jgi:hypothetical protein
MNKSMAFVIIVVCVYVNATLAIAASTERGNDFVFSGNISSSVDKLPKNYTGDDFIKVYDKLAGVASKKGEYEKTTDYQERVSSQGGKIYAFKQVMDKGKKDYSFKYDPDSEEILVMPHTGYTLGYETKGGPDSRIEFVVNEINSNSGNYVGQNSFGAHTVVKKYRSISYMINSLNMKNLINSTNPRGKDPNFTIKMSVSDAKKYKGSLDILIIGITPNDSVQTYSDGRVSNPTISSPKDILWSYKGIHLKILQIWVYNSLTGEVVEKKFIDNI